MLLVGYTLDKLPAQKTRNSILFVTLNEGEASHIEFLRTTEYVLLTAKLFTV